MAVPWLVVGNLVLGNIDKIMAVVRPGFTQKKIDSLHSQTDLLNQQIAELQSASAANAEQIRALAIQLKDVVGALEQAGSEAAKERAVTRRIAYVALGLGVAALATGIFALFH
jgi:outer membrane murein-binding lipoprotein Lpp